MFYVTAFVLFFIKSQAHVTLDFGFCFVLVFFSIFKKVLTYFL